MIGDSQVRHSPVPRGLRHLGQGGRTIAPVGVAMKRAGQVAELEQVGKLAGLGGLDLAADPPAARAGSRPAQAPRRPRPRSRQGTGPFSPESAYSFSESPRAIARLRMAILWAFEPVK